MRRLRIFTTMSLFSLAVLSFFSISFSNTAQAGLPWFPNTVEDLQVERYVGKWYQVASTNPRFQENCFCVTAEYSVIAEDELSVVNSCRLNSVEGELDIVEGTARIPNLSEKSKLNVNFGGIRFPFPNYWVIEVGEAYEYAVVSSPFRNPIWILSREPSLPEATIEGIKSRLRENHFNTSALTPSVQEGCLE